MLQSALSIETEEPCEGGNYTKVFSRELNSIPPLVVPMSQPYALSGAGVVSTRAMQHFGYNGLEFRKFLACPGLQNINDPLVQERSLIA